MSLLKGDIKKKSMVPNIFCHDNIIRFSAFISKYFFSSIFDKVITVNLHYIAMWIFCLTGDVSFKNQQLTILLQKLWGPKLTLILKNISYTGHIRKRSTENLKSKTSGDLEPFKNLVGEPGSFQEHRSKPPRFLFLRHF